MTKKQLKQLAKKIADYEYIIKFSKDKNEVEDAKRKMIQATDSAKIEDLNEMMQLDTYTQSYIDEKINATQNI